MNYYTQWLQHLIDSYPRQQYAVIAAVDNKGGFSKDGKIPWYYPEDFKWFKNITNNNICVMGRNTYNDINERLGEKATESVLPNRKCFVVSNTLTELPNATVVRSIREVESHNEDPLSPIFIIGGGKLYTEGVALAQHIYLTIINKDWECDGFLPMDYIFKHFQISKVLGTEQAPDIRFFQMQRKQVN